MLISYKPEKTTISESHMGYYMSVTIDILEYYGKLIKINKKTNEITLKHVSINCDHVTNFHVLEKVKLPIDLVAAYKVIEKPK